MGRTIELYSLLGTLIDTIDGTSITIPTKNLHDVLTHLRVMQTKLDILYIQSELLNIELRTMNNHEPTKNSELVIVRNNPLFEEDELHVEDAKSHNNSNINECGFEEQ